jgi:hypothetical protein
LVVGSPACRAAPLKTLIRLGFTCAELDDPYAAMAELCRRPMVYRAMILSLASLYREELALIPSVKRRWPHLEIWLTQTDGRHAALADAMRLGADGLVSEDGLHRTGVTGGMVDTVSPVIQTPLPRIQPPAASEPEATQDSEAGAAEPILTADELRALLAEQPTMPPGGED